MLDARALYAHAQAADALYRASLRHEFASRTPVECVAILRGRGAGRRTRRGIPGALARTPRERGEKLSWTRDDTMRSWSRDLARFEPLGVVDASSRERRVLDEHRFAGALEGRHDVARRHVVAAWADAATFGQDPRELIRQIDVMLSASPRARGRLRAHDAGARRSHHRRRARTSDRARWRRLSSTRGASAHSRPRGRERGARGRRRKRGSR